MTSDYKTIAVALWFGNVTSGNKCQRFINDQLRQDDKTQFNKNRKSNKGLNNSINYLRSEPL
ncbi:hypothetical protein HI914_05261 [Erysiphe necator]|nr:hypothetical protein HI914_05261 [Erysiphe necator]